MNLYGYLIAGLLALCLAGSIFYAGVRYERGNEAIERQAAIDDAVKRAREDAALESSIAMASAKAAEDRRTAAQARQHKLEVELAKDESARNCRISDGTFRVLSEAITETNASPGASSRDVGMRPVTDPGRSGGIRPVTLDIKLGSGLPTMSIPPTRTEGVD